jgi:hypothetical protein
VPDGDIVGHHHHLPFLSLSRPPLFQLIGQCYQWSPLQAPAAERMASGPFRWSICLPAGFLAALPLASSSHEGVHSNGIPDWTCIGVPASCRSATVQLVFLTSTSPSSLSSDTAVLNGNATSESGWNGSQCTGKFRGWVGATSKVLLGDLGTSPNLHPTISIALSPDMHQENRRVHWYTPGNSWVSPI